ncbi:hypothetical protein [Mucilaginibacter sp.]
MDPLTPEQIQAMLDENASLKLQLANLTSANTELATQVTNLQTQNADLTTHNTNLIGTNDEVKKSFYGIQKELDTAEDIIEQQSSKIEELTKNSTIKGTKLTVVVGKDNFTIKHGVKLDGVVYSPASISESTDVAAKLVAMGSAALVKIVPEVTE